MNLSENWKKICRVSIQSSRELADTMATVICLIQRLRRRKRSIDLIEIFGPDLDPNCLTLMIFL